MIHVQHFSYLHFFFQAAIFPLFLQTAIMFCPYPNTPRLPLLHIISITHIMEYIQSFSAPIKVIIWRLWIILLCQSGCTSYFPISGPSLSCSTVIPLISKRYLRLTPIFLYILHRGAVEFHILCYTIHVIWSCFSFSLAPQLSFIRLAFKSLFFFVSFQDAL